MNLRRVLPMCFAMLAGCSESEPEPSVDTGVEDAVAEAGDSTVDSGPDVVDATPDADATVDTADASEAAVDAADAVVTDAVDAADTSVDAAETSVDAADTSVDAAETSVAETSVDAAEASVDAADAVADSAPSTPTEVWVVRVGTGAAALDTSSTETFIDRIALPGGAVLGTINLPTAASGANYPLTIRGDAFVQGRLHRSLDGHFVTMAGYATPPGTADIDLAWTVPRVVARVHVGPTIEIDTTTTATSDSLNIFVPYAAVTTDGTKFWMAGASGGISYMALGNTGAATVVSHDSGGLMTPELVTVRDLDFLNGGFVGCSVTSGARLFQYPPPLPTTLTAASTPAPTYTGNTAGIAAFQRPGDSDIIYVCDGSGLARWEATGSTWTMKLALTTPCRGITGYPQAGKFVLIGVPYLAASSNQLFMLVDDPASTTVPTPTTIATAPTNTAYRGVSLPPTP